MTRNSFIQYLLLVSAGTAALLWASMSLFPAWQVHRNFMPAVLAFFSLLSVALYAAAVQSLRSTNKYAFTNFVSASVFIKMVASLVFLLVWRKLYAPADQGYVAMFLVCYVAYTGYEVWFMTRMARQDA
jgi:hypothetical protein